MTEKNVERETWEANGRVVLEKYDHAGRVREVLVNKGRKVQLTEDERLMNQDRCVNEDLDPFINGTLSPVRLPKTDSESLQAIVENPNTMSEADINELIDSHTSTFKKRINEITSPYIIKKLLAKAQDPEREDMSVKKVEALEARLSEITASDVKVVEHEKIYTNPNAS